MVSNPPFVVGPGVATHTYRDSGRAGDAVCAELAAAAPGLLTEGGTMQFLANWVHVAGEDWEDRVAGWFAGTGLDAWVIQREVADPLAYVELWLADAGETADPQRAAAWLDWFDAHKVEAVGFGLVTLRRGGHADPVVRVEDLRQQVQPPLGDAGGRLVRPAGLAAAHATPRRCSPRATGPPTGLQLRQEATMGDDGWAVDRQVLGDAARPALDRGDRPAGAGAGRRLRRHGCRCATSSPCWRRRTRSSRRRAGRGRRRRSWRTWSSAGIMRAGRARPDAGGGADRQPGQRDGRRRGGRRRSSDGLLVLLGVTHTDTPATAETMARKVHELRILDDERSAADVGAPMLVVSQFTLYGDARKGRRPTWTAAAPAEVAEPLVDGVRRGAARAGRDGRDRPVPRPHAGRERQRRPPHPPPGPLTDPRHARPSPAPAAG